MFKKFLIVLIMIFAFSTVSYCDVIPFKAHNANRLTYENQKYMQERAAKNKYDYKYLYTQLAQESNFRKNSINLNVVTCKASGKTVDEALNNLLPLINKYVMSTYVATIAYTNYKSLLESAWYEKYKTVMTENDWITMVNYPNTLFTKHPERISYKVYDKGVQAIVKVPSSIDIGIGQLNSYAWKAENAQKYIQQSFGIITYMGYYEEAIKKIVNHYYLHFDVENWEHSKELDEAYEKWVEDKGTIPNNILKMACLAIYNGLDSVYDFWIDPDTINKASPKYRLLNNYYYKLFDDVDGILKLFIDDEETQIAKFSHFKTNHDYYNEREAYNAFIYM